MKINKFIFCLIIVLIGISGFFCSFDKNEADAQSVEMIDEMFPEIYEEESDINFLERRKKKNKEIKENKPKEKAKFTYNIKLLPIIKNSKQPTTDQELVMHDIKLKLYEKNVKLSFSDKKFQKRKLKYIR